MGCGAGGAYGTNFPHSLLHWNLNCPLCCHGSKNSFQESQCLCKEPDLYFVKCSDNRSKKMWVVVCRIYPKNTDLDTVYAVKSAVSSVYKGFFIQHIILYGIYFWLSCLSTCTLASAQITAPLWLGAPLKCSLPVLPGTQRWVVKKNTHQPNYSAETVQPCFAASLCQQCKTGLNVKFRQTFNFLSSHTIGHEISLGR